MYSIDVSVSVCLYLSLSVSVCLCSSLSVSVCLCVSVCFCVFLCVSVCQSLPYTYCTYAMLCTMHVFSAFIWPFHCIHIAVTKAHAACRRPKSFVRRCTSETILTSADAACRRPVSFLRMMHRWIMAPEFQPKERLAKDQFWMLKPMQPLGVMWKRGNGSRGLHW